MKIKFQRIKKSNFLFLTYLLVFSVSVWSETQPSLTLSDELKEQRLMFYSTKSDFRYAVALSNFKRINSEWTAENEKYVIGDLQRATFEFSSNVSFSRAWTMLLDNFLSSDSETLFECRGLDCGSSNVWANDYFGIKQLYGLDQSQRYKVVKTVKADRELYFVLYLVKRGNRRIHAQADVITARALNKADTSNVEYIVEQLKNQAFWVFPIGAENRVKSRDVDTIRVMSNVKQAIEKYVGFHPNAQLQLVGHDRRGRKIEEQLTNGEERAQAIAEYFKSLKVDFDFDIRSVGGLAPRSGIYGTRVELVVQPQ